MKAPIILWHGARSWEGPPEIRKARQGRTEHGPGIYLTTTYATARRYSKGGGVTLKFLLDPNLAWLEDATLLRADVEAFVRTQARLRKRRELLEDVSRAAERMRVRLGGDRIPAATIVNLAVNHNALAGEAGPALAAFLVRHGIDASLVEAKSDEDWVVLFNVTKIRAVELVPASSVNGAWAMPLLRRMR